MKKVPRLRFRGFSEEWELCKLGDSVRFINGRAYKQKELLDTGKYRVLRVGNFNTNDRWYYSDLELPEEKYANKGDLLYLWATSFGPEIWDNERVIYHYHIWKLDIIDPNIDKQYLNIWLETDKERIKQNTNGTTMVHVTKSNMEQREFKLPKLLAEQEKIGYFFKQINKTITLHQRKLDQLKELKKAYLQVMFPEKDEIVPRMRFVDFEGEWELCKLGDVANRYDNLRVPITASKRISGNTPYYGANGIQDFVEGYTHDGEFILVAEDGANDLKDYPVQYVNGKVWVNNHAHVLQAKQSIANNKFLMNAIKNINIELFLVGGSRAKLNADIMMKLEINMPVKNEQIRVSEFCTQLDNIITIYQNKLNQLKSLKKSYLQNMFI
ncbi:restriction endonuclease subunit S [Enterococcus faecalis]|nr:restriction endonuclease subunit S [Enterococcus faecalis]EGO9487427.1 restriction endonuclease subunit S [Enterococcus faecalis]